MPELNREQIALLETLIQSEVDGTGAGEHIDRIRRPDGRLPEHDRYGRWTFPESEEYRAIERDLCRLLEIGLLEPTHQADGFNWKFGNLTSDGRCYLADREEQERRREREERCRRSHDYRVAIFSALLSFAVGFALGCITGGAL